MIERHEENHSNYRLICDVCGLEVERNFPDFDAAVTYKKRHGWKSQRRGGEWEDVCPECRELGGAGS